MKSKNLALFLAAALLFIVACMCSDTANIPTTDATNIPPAPTLDSQSRKRWFSASSKTLSAPST